MKPGSDVMKKFMIENRLWKILF